MAYPCVLGLIPARGGSKGIPRKNLRILVGQPLIVHTIQAALTASRLDRVIVTTDDEEIAGVALRAGAEVPFLRPGQYATDTASSLSVVHHALAWLSMHEQYRPDAVALLAPTCPLRTSAQIDATVALLWASGLDSALTVTEVRDHPYYVYRQREDGQLEAILHVDKPPLRRQDMPVFYAPSQAVIVSRTSYLKVIGDPQPVFNPASMAGYPIDYASGFDIDAPVDLVVAEALLQERLLTYTPAPVTHDAVPVR